MVKDLDDLTPKTRREIRDLANMPDSDINTDDVPEITDWVDVKRGLFFWSSGKTRPAP